MRILQIINYPGRGGAEQYAYLLAKYAQNSGHKVAFVFGQDGPLVSRVKDLGCETFFVTMRSPFDPIAIYDLRQIYSKWKPDIVHTHFLRENFVAIAANKLHPIKGIFSTVHRIESKTQTQAFFNKTYSKGITKFIAVSELAKEYLIEEGVNEHKVVVIPNGAEIKKYSKQKIKNELKVPKDHKIITCVARFTPEKGHKCLIEAYSKINNSKTKLVLVGDGELLGEMRVLAKKKNVDDRIMFLGGRNNAYEIMGVSDMVVQPSKIETFSITTLEAMLQKIPIVASDIPAFKRLLGNKLGLLFRANNSKDLALKIDYALTNEREMQQMAKKAYDIAISKYTTEKMWLNTEKLFKKYSE